MWLLQRMGIGDEIARDSSVMRHTVIRDSQSQEIAMIEAEPCDQGWESHYSISARWLIGADGAHAGALRITA